jgi:hypothetical protein
MVNTLDFSRIKLICHGKGTTMEEISTRMNRSYSGFRKACQESTFSAQELILMAEIFEMELLEFVEALSNSELKYLKVGCLKKKPLSGIKDPLQFIRALMDRSETLDRLIDKAEK